MALLIKKKQGAPVGAIRNRGASGALRGGMLMARRHSCVVEGMRQFLLVEAAS